MAPSLENPIKTFAPWIGMLAAGLVTWGFYQAKLSANEENDHKLDQRVSVTESAVNEIKNTVVKIDTTQNYSAAELERVRMEQEKLNAQLTQLLLEIKRTR